ncbi:MAG: hypothetical protein HY080_01920 [Gammaproteobacteria bacterium]|nr:hypothetical protein [Gammaproteobacteria bacterium]
MNNDTPELVFITHEEGLDGLRDITNGNRGLAHGLVDKAIDKTREEFQSILREMSGEHRRPETQRPGRSNAPTQG